MLDHCDLLTDSSLHQPMDSMVTMWTLLFTDYDVSVSIQHNSHAMFCTSDYSRSRVKDLLHLYPHA